MVNDAGDLFMLDTTIKSDSMNGTIVFRNPKAVSLGFSEFVLTNEGRILGKGENRSGQLGNGSISETEIQTEFVDVFPAPSARLFKQVSAGYRHVLGLQTDGTIMVWGANELGQLGIGNTLDQPTPVQVNF